MADPRERWNDHDESLRIAADRHQSIMWTAMPVAVTEDSDGHTCELQIRIKGQKRDTSSQETSTETYDIPPIGMVPIHFAAGGGLTITHPVKKDDEGMAVFQSRCIDSWHDQGGQQEEQYRRRHSLSDAMYIPGFRNKPRKLNPGPSTDAVHIRVDDGKHYIEMHKDGSVTIYATKVNVHAPEINMDGDTKDQSGQDTKVEIKGTLHCTKDISTDTNVNAKQNMTADQTVTGRQEVTARSINLTSHRHIASGGTGISGPPMP